MPLSALGQAQEVALLSEYLGSPREKERGDSESSITSGQSQWLKEQSGGTEAQQQPVWAPGAAAWRGKIPTSSEEREG